MSTLIFIRHGSKLYDNRSGIPPYFDSPITDNNIIKTSSSLNTKLKSIGVDCSKIDSDFKIISSPYFRTMQTAYGLNYLLRIVNYVPNRNTKEGIFINNSVMEYLGNSNKIAEVKRDADKIIGVDDTHKYFLDETATLLKGCRLADLTSETVPKFRRRAIKFCDSLLNGRGDSQIPKICFIVTHGFLMSICAEYLTGIYGETFEDFDCFSFNTVTKEYRTSR